MLPKAVIFDMDGLLIDSEPLWREAEINLFKKAGIELTNELCKQSMGMRLDEVINYWYAKNPHANYPRKVLHDEILDEVMRLIYLKGEAMPGVFVTIDFFRCQNIKTAIASSSAIQLINAVVDKLKLQNHFNVLHSAQYEVQGKPHPAVFLTTAKKLDVHPSNCLVFEDSVLGITGAINAGMKVIAVPDSENYDDVKFDAADLKLKSLTDFNVAVLSRIFV